jgi:hypothetical protein
MEENGSTREEINYRIKVNYNMFSLLATKSGRITRMFIFGYMTTLLLSTAIVLSIKALINLPNIFYTLCAILSSFLALYFRLLTKNEVRRFNKYSETPINEAIILCDLYKCIIHYIRAACIECTFYVLLVSNIFYVLFLINLRIEDLIISGLTLLLGITILTISNILCKDVYNILHKQGNKN